MAHDLSSFSAPQKLGVLKDRDQEKAKGGRPPKAADELLKNKVTVNFSDAERERLEATAKQWGMPITTLIRMALKDKDYI